MLLPRHRGWRDQQVISSVRHHARHVTWTGTAMLPRLRRLNLLTGRADYVHLWRRS